MALRYVVLHHEGVADPHFDLMCETAPDSLLATWRCPGWPISGPTLLERIGEHRRVYLQFEGSLTGNRGSVRRVADGECVLQPGGGVLLDGQLRVHQEGGNWLIEPAK